MEEITQNLNDYLKSCPVWIIEKSVEQLKTILTEEILEQTKNFHKNDPDTWWASYHHGWGTGIRNFLRDKVCLDD